MLLVQGQSYKQQFGFNSIHLLPVNLYGPGDNFDPHYSHVIPALIRKFAKAKFEGKNLIVVWGTGRASREFFYVGDAARVIVLATQRYYKSEPVNIGASFEITIRELVDLIASIMKFKGQVIWDKTKPDGQPRRKLDTTRAKRESGFASRIPFEKGLRKTIYWYLKSYKTLV